MILYFEKWYSSSIKNISGMSSKNTHKQKCGKFPQKKNLKKKL